MVTSKRPVMTSKTPVHCSRHISQYVSRGFGKNQAERTRKTELRKTHFLAVVKLHSDWILTSCQMHKYHLMIWAESEAYDDKLWPAWGLNKNLWHLRIWGRVHGSYVLNSMLARKPRRNVNVNIKEMYIMRLRSSRSVFTQSSKMRTCLACGY